MKNKILIMTFISILTQFLSVSSAFAQAEERIIQQEKMSFERCLQVITVSENRLSVSATISDISKRKRTATFVLADGFLTITCDAEKNNVTVSTKSN